MHSGEEEALPPGSAPRGIRLPLALVAGMLILLVASLVTNLAQVLGRIDVPPDVPLVAGASLDAEPAAGSGGSSVVPAGLPPELQGQREEPIFW